jgi:hypothetical protein
MKRRLFLHSLWTKGIALPAAYILSPRLDARAADELPITAEGRKVKAHGCARTEDGNPYLELIRLLKEASEIEHSLMIQYLFACFTLKPQYQSIVGPPAPSSDGLLGIAIEEMQHLAVVNRLLVALGAAPNLDVQDLPIEPDIYPFPLSLERLTRNSLARYTYVESGRESIPMTGDIEAIDQLLCDELTAELGTDTGLNRVAALYSIVIKQLEKVAAEDEIKIDNLDDWLSQLRKIMIEGEQNHFRFFSNLFLGRHPAFEGKGNPWKLPEDHPDHPSFDVQPNPSAYFGHDNQIKSPEARALAWLSDLHYWMVLIMLDLHYRDESEGLNAMAQTHMVGPLQALGTRLAEYGTGLPFDRLSVGYSPAPDRAGNLDFLARLSWEADTFAHKMKSDLPPGYPLELHEATMALIEAERKKLGQAESG